MHRTHIKICGITRSEDALAAADAGADAIGMILHADAPRKISLDIAREIMKAIPSKVAPIGVFVDADTELILKTARDLRLQRVQLHGNEPPESVVALNDLVVTKA